MAAITPYSRYSQFQHTSATDLIARNVEISQTIFPSCRRQGSSQIATFLLTTSGGGYTLILGEGIAFMNLRNSCDPLREVCPVLFDCVPRGCSAELVLAVRDHGQAIQDTPPFVALQIDYDSRNYEQTNDPHAELARLIRGEVAELYIGNYRIRKMPNSWQPPAGNPGWRGLAFEQDDRVVRTWIHEANPNALQRAQADAQRSIDAAVTTLARARTNEARADVQRTLDERRNFLAYLTAQTVNSAAKTTLQCAITMQIDEEDKIQLLNRYVCQEIVSVIDYALKQISWQALQIRRGAIENFIRQKFNALIRKLPVLVENSSRVPTDWEDFRDQVLPEKRTWIQQTFEDFCQEQVGRRVPNADELPRLEELWKEGLSKKLKWVTEKLRQADEQLKIINHTIFISTDIRIFDEHRQRMVQVLRRGGEMTYALGEELQERYEQRNLIREAIRNHRWVQLVKRVGQGGKIYFGVTRPPADPSERPDPNERLNEVHIPVIHVSHPIQVDARHVHHGPPPARSYQWLWVTSGLILVLGIWIYHRYFSASDVFEGE